VKRKFSWTEFMLWKRIKTRYLLKNCDHFTNSWAKKKSKNLIRLTSGHLLPVGEFQKTTSVIYGIFSTNTPRFYIGETQDLKTRAEHHFRQSRKITTVIKRGPNPTSKKITNELRGKGVLQLYKHIAETNVNSYIIIPLKVLGRLEPLIESKI